MKKLLKFSFLLAVVLSTAGMHANVADFSLLVKKEEGKTVQFTLNTSEKTDLSLFDPDNELIHSETILGKQIFNRSYNLSTLPDGIYILEAKTALKTARYEITLSGNTATVVEKPVAEVYKPTLVHENRVVTLSILNFNSAPVNVIIYGTDGTEWYEGTFEGKQDFFKKFDLSRIPTGIYTFDISYNGRNFSNTVAIK